ncbi:uncharacterized protein LOC103516509 isoform X3 [Diaphorina citri]|uniref:Uncharacterized protein LOC103516509 isoform X3 n=1 Tax=Diaphorina citri TaxID=121845 RepID=A0A3Q0JD90_DIACI|nr:uncharacterized protein LOC103516509 isoform X3 [Diaphorina citri]
MLRYNRYGTSARISRISRYNYNPPYRTYFPTTLAYAVPKIKCSNNFIRWSGTIPHATSYGTLSTYKTQFKPKYSQDARPVRSKYRSSVTSSLLARQYSDDYKPRVTTRFRASRFELENSSKEDIAKSASEGLIAPMRGLCSLTTLEPTTNQETQTVDPEVFKKTKRKKHHRNKTQERSSNQRDGGHENSTPEVSDETVLHIPNYHNELRPKNEKRSKTIAYDTTVRSNETILECEFLKENIERNRKSGDADWEKSKRYGKTRNAYTKRNAYDVNNDEWGRSPTKYISPTCSKAIERKYKRGTIDISGYTPASSYGRLKQLNDSDITGKNTRTSNNNGKKYQDESTDTWGIVDNRKCRKQSRRGRLAHEFKRKMFARLSHVPKQEKQDITNGVKRVETVRRCSVSSNEFPVKQKLDKEATEYDRVDETYPTESRYLKKDSGTGESNYSNREFDRKSRVDSAYHVSSCTILNSRYSRPSITPSSLCKRYQTRLATVPKCYASKTTQGRSTFVRLHSKHQPISCNYRTGNDDSCEPILRIRI